MSMPPSGVDGLAMDEEAAIEAEIQLELENINLDNDPGLDDDPQDDPQQEDGGYVPGFGLEGGEDQEAQPDEKFVDVPHELDTYIKSIQDQSSKFERELMECDDILNHTKPTDGQSQAIIPYEDQSLLTQLAQDRGCTVEEYQRQILAELEDKAIIEDELAGLIDDDVEILAELEDDEVIIEDELAGLIDDNVEIIGNLVGGEEGQMKALTQHGEGQLEPAGDKGGRDGLLDGRVEVQVQKALEEGMDPSEVPVSQDLVPINGDVTRPGHLTADIQQMLRNQLEKLEARYQQRIDKIKQDEACRRDEEEVQQRRTEEERQEKRQQIEREERKLALQQQAAQAEMEKQEAEFLREMQQSRMKFEAEMAELQAETELQRREYEQRLDEEARRQADRQQLAVVKIQATYRGYRVRKDVAPTLNVKREERRQHQQEERIKEVEIEIERRKEEQKQYEQQKREKEEELKQLEEEKKRQKEEEKRQKELEKKQREEEKRRLKEEEERKKQEEKKRKEEEKQRKKEEERKRKEEEKKQKEEEELKKNEEKRIKEEEEKRKKEEIKRQKEEEKRRKEEEAKKKKEEEKLKKEEEQKKKEEQKENDGKNIVVEEKKNNNEANEGIDAKTAQENRIVNSTNNTENQISKANNDVKNISKSTDVECKVANSLDIETSQKKTNKADNDATKQTETLSEEAAIVNKQGEKSNQEPDKVSTPRTQESGTPRTALTKTPRSARKPKPPTPRKPSKDVSPRPWEGEIREPERPDNSDCLPDHLEKMRLQFIKQCLPWSIVANEPWKLKAGVSKRPLRRPSSAKKLPLLAENIILDAAKVASLKQVTTVQLCDLPGSNMSSMGQCWGLRYLSLTNCNLVALDSLAQCKQLQYLDAQNNKLEFVDVKDIGQLQYVNLSHNRLSSIHGLDNCTNLRWLDLSHNNITRLGGLETLRRLCCLKLHHNQLISTTGLGATPTLHTLDISHNNLQAAEDLEKLCLLSTLDLSFNNLLQVPKLSNQVLLQELLLGDNSLSSLDVLSTTWLPLLNKLVLAQNSIENLPLLEAWLSLKELDISNNQLLDADMIHKSIEKCVFLEQLHLEENPVSEEIDKGFYEKLRIPCPRLQCESSTSKSVPIKPRTSFETMCLTQCQSVRDIVAHFDNSLKSFFIKGQQPDLAQYCDAHYKFCDKLFNTLVEYRNAHEYGEVTVTVPSAPKTPKSRPTSARQKDKFMNPKDMFENALKASNQSQNNKEMFENALKRSSHISTDKDNNDVMSSNNDSDSKKVVVNSLVTPKFDSTMTKTRVQGGQTTQMDTSSDPRDLFEQALKSAGSGATKPTVNSGLELQPTHLINGVDKRVAAATTLQAYCRGWLVRHEIAEQTKIWLAATTIQAHWKGHRVRRITKPEIERRRHLPKVDSGQLRHLHQSAIKIQALWRGYILRKKLLAALEYAQCDFSDDEEDQDAMDLNDEFDVDKFLDMNEDQLDSDDWKPPETPDIPLSHPVLRKPPSGKPRIPPIGTPSGEYRPPSNPRRAWKNLESPLSDYGKVPHPPSSLVSGTLTARSGMSKKEEKLTEEWGFKDTSTAHLMMERAKKMKYNAERRKKIRKLDPKQRLALFRKLEEVTGRPTYQVPQQKTMPRKEYFQARQEEVVRQEQEKREEFHTRVSRTFEWLHTQVGDHPVSDSVINQTGPRYVAQPNLPELQGGRVQLISSPILELQSVDSASTSGQRARRFSVGSGGSTSKLPPIGYQPQTTSAPTSHVKERMSFRNKKVNHDVGWGGGKKRTNKF